MTTVSARTLTHGGAYLVRRARQLAERLAKKPGTSSDYEVIDTYILRATSTGGRAAGLVIDPPAALIMIAPESTGELPVAFQYKTREWYDSRLNPDAESITREDLPNKESYAYSRALYDSPPAALDTGRGGLFPVAALPWAAAGIEARYSIQYAHTLVSTNGIPVEYVDVLPYGIRIDQPYGVSAQLHIAQAKPLTIQISYQYLKSEIASEFWRFGPHKSIPVDVRVGLPITRIAQITPHARDVVVVGTTFKSESLPEIDDILSMPLAGLFLLAHSQRQMNEKWAEDEDGLNKFEDGLLWHAHYELADLFPILETGPYLCAPRYNNDYSFNFPPYSEAYKVWIKGDYTEDVPPTDIGRLPCFLSRLCVATTEDEIHIVAGVTWFTTEDWSEIDPEDVEEPLLWSQLFCCNGLMTLRFDHKGELLDSALEEIDSTAGPDQLDFDKIELDRSKDISRFVQPDALMVLQGQVLQVRSEWVESRRNDRHFSIVPWIDKYGTVDLEQSGIRALWKEKDYFFSIEESGVFTWARLDFYETETPDEGGWLIQREYPETDAPGAVQITPTQIGFIGYKIDPLGEMVFCVIDLLTGELSIRGELKYEGENLKYEPPHPRNDRVESQYDRPQNPPVLSVAQQQIIEDGEQTIEAVILLSFAPRIPSSLISKDSGETWEVHIDDAQSPVGVHFAPNVLHTKYESGTAVAVPVPEE